MMLVTTVIGAGLFALLLGCLLKPGKAFPWFLLLLCAHMMIMMLGFILGVNTGVLRWFSAWKEIALVAIVCCGLARRRDESGGLLAGPGGFQPLLVALVAFVGLHVVLTLIFGKVGDTRGPLLEMRVLLVMLLAYYAGKVIVRDLGAASMLKHIVWGAAICSVWGIVELFVFDEAFWVGMGYPAYLRDFRGQHYNTASGVQENWYTIIAGTPVRRAMSVFMSSQPFAKMLIVALPAALLFCVWRPSRFMLAATVIMSLALLATLTRACILGVAAMSAIYFLGTRGTRKVPLLVTGVAIILVLFVYSETTTSFWDETLSFEDPSSRTHLHVWQQTMALIWEKPLLGHGAGSRAGVAERLSSTPSTRSGEQTFLIFASQYGLFGLLLYVCLMTCVMTKAIRLHRHGGDTVEPRLLGGALFIIWGTIILDSLTTYMWGSPYIAIVPWMVVGAADHILAQPAATAAPNVIDFKTIEEHAA